ncbi:MAG: hypothetical protein Q7S56_00665 [Nanoarchaeota archaeon]|nr:hypothetical protein [Nanoarchaeota archaeon]
MSKKEVEEKRKEKRNLRRIFLTITVAFAIIAFWRGVWGLLDIYLLPNNPQLSFWISIGLGVAILYSTENLVKRLI